MQKMESKTKHLVASDLLAGLDSLPETDYSIDALPEIRKAVDQQIKSWLEYHGAATRDTVKVSRRTIPGPEGAPEIDILIYEPVDRTPGCGALLDIHGGGYVIGSAEMDEGFNRKICNELGLVVISVEYRLPPDTPFPGPIEDCYAALTWLFENTADMDVNKANIGVIGLSAGGGLAAALAILARDRGDYDLAYQCLIFPMLDDRTAATDDPNPYSGEFVYRKQDNHFGWSCLLGHEPGISGVSPYASPARVEDMTGLPNAFIWCGALDLFVDEDIDYAKRLIRSGVPTELHIYPGAYHGSVMIETAESTKAMWEQLLKFIGDQSDTTKTSQLGLAKINNV